MPANPGPPWSGAPAFSVLSAASFQGEGAPEALASALGLNLATTAGIEVAVIDSTGVARVAPLTYVSPAQVNFQVPPETTIGQATVIVATSDGAVISGALPVGVVAPGIFSAAGNGLGVAAAVVLVTHPDATQTAALTFSCDGAAHCDSVPVNLGAAGDRAALELYGTGIRGRTSLAGVACTIAGIAAEVLYAGPQGSFPGLDQVNIVLPRSLAGKGEVTIVLNVDGRVANVVTVNMR